MNPSNSPTRHFASDNYAGVHPTILEAIARANTGHAPAYGGDEHTLRAERKFKEAFGPEAEVFFVFNGTAANVLSLQALTRSHQSVICSEISHIHTDECGAPEKFTGSKLIALPTFNGKLTLETLEEYWARGTAQTQDQHHSQARVLSLTQATEWGTVYTRDEISRLTRFAHERGLLVHMDGSRLANAAASLKCTLKEATTDLGVDVLSLGGTKNGLLFGEAVVFLKAGLSSDFKYIRKQGMQLASKMRFISAQFEALLSDDLWFRNAEHANHMAKKLETELRRVAQNGSAVKISRSTDANAVFATLPKKVIERLQEKFLFYVWGPAQEATRAEVRWMTSYDTTPEDISIFIQCLENSLG